jgi:predicted GNAT family acetyltransferase
MAETEYSHRTDGPDRHVCDAHQDGRNVGYTVTLDRRDFLWLDEVYVKPECRGQGIARTLVDRTIARHQGREIRLKPEPYGARSGLSLIELVAFYSRRGFRWDGEHMFFSTDLNGHEGATMTTPTMMRLCDDDGVVRSGGMHHGADFVCTGSAHFQGLHIWCDNRVHEVRVEEGVYVPHARTDWEASGARTLTARVVKV